MTKGIPLDTFEDYIDEVILERGKNYVLSKAVHIKNKSRTLVKADCVGTNLYQVQVNLADNHIVNHECNCPFEYGPFCKHVTAVLYLIRDSLEIQESSGRKEKMLTENRKDDLIERMLNDMRKEDLVKLVQQWTVKYYTLEKDLKEFLKGKL